MGKLIWTEVHLSKVEAASQVSGSQKKCPDCGVSITENAACCPSCFEKRGKERDNSFKKSLVAQKGEIGEEGFDKKLWAEGKFTNENLEAILYGLREGLPLQSALAEAHITERLYRIWLKKDREGNRRYGGITEMFEMARWEGITKWIRTLMSLSKKDGKLVIEILKIIYPEGFRTDKVMNLIQNNMNIQYIDVDDDGKRVE